ncbi:MAG: peptidylprolyl isomerase [Treponemataceae bacterium]|nr:MAG: peptidylprolyl isomerase [Treponemataceae bacterium]
MKIEKDKVVSLLYTLKDESGAVIDCAEKDEPFLYVHGAGDIIPGLEKALAGKNVQESFDVAIEAKDAYGEYREELVFEVPREQFPKEAEVAEGLQFEAEMQNGSVVATVISVDEAKKTVTVDTNHPLAGEKLFFSVTVCDVRDATKEELAHGLYGHCDCGDDDCDCDGEDGCGCAHHH